MSNPLTPSPDTPSPSRVQLTRWDDDGAAYVMDEADPPRVGSRPWVHALLLALTFITTTYAGASFYANYITAVGTRPFPTDTSALSLLVGGLWFSVPALLILGSHEMGHYVACRYYRIPATLPYFIPAPLVLVGTFGAVIRMGLPRTRPALFDVGIAGPIAGFLVTIPVAIFGVAASYVSPIPAGFRPAGEVFNLGDPLLLTWLQSSFHGAVSPRSVFVSHPSGFAAWFGLLATALNLIPIGQLDGGHIVHALVGRASRYVTMVAMAVVVVLAFTVASSWMLWGGLLLVMLFAFGLDHPPVEDAERPIGRERVVLGVCAVIMFALCFTPTPISVTDFLGASR